MSKPRVGFLGVGWIGRHRMQAMLATDAIEAAAIVDPSPECVAEATKLAPGAGVLHSYEAMLALGLDGIVIATPSAGHAEQSLQALRSGAAVFCQKPLGRNTAEVRAVVEAARKADRLLGVDLSYRHTHGMQRIRALIRAGELGKVFAADLVFHNAYGPDKEWFYDPARSGGGCLMDLGVHLVDLVLWALDWPEVARVSGQLLAGGEPLQSGQVEDYAVATLELASGAVVRIACSWRLHAGREAEIGVRFYGTNGGAALRNVGGSFYDLVAERFSGTSTQELAGLDSNWGGRAAAEWARGLAAGECFSEDAERLVRVSVVMDALYRR